MMITDFTDDGSPIISSWGLSFVSNINEIVFDINDYENYQNYYLVNIN